MAIGRRCHTDVERKAVCKTGGRMRFFAGWIFAALALFLLGGCQKKAEPVEGTAFLLNTFVTVTVYDKADQEVVDGCLELCRSYEELFSKTIETSEIYRMNHRLPEENTFEVSRDTAEMLKKGLYYSERSGGAFDITVEPLSSLWDFTGEEHKIPPKDQIAAAAARVDYRNMSVEGKQVTFSAPGTSVDPGAVAKGYIADRMKEYLIRRGIKSAIINLGGNVLCVGKKPEGTPFKIGLQKPFADRNETAAILNIEDVSVVSSGVYERHFVAEGVNYHHLLNPKTGYPYSNGLISVTVITPESVDGDGLSTACFSMGLEKGMALIDSIEGSCAVFITEDYKLHYSEGAERFVAEG